MDQPELAGLSGSVGPELAELAGSADSVQSAASQSHPIPLFEFLALRQNIVAVAAIVLIVGAAWAYLIGSPGSSHGMAGSDMAGMEMAGPSFQPWGAREGLLLFVMWAVMMVAMMLPSAAPTLLLFSRIGASRLARGRESAPVAALVVGYLLVWWAFSAVAAFLQWSLHSVAVLSPDMRAVSPMAAGLVLIAAGIYQWLPIKLLCLRQCRSPFGFISTYWRDGYGGALRMGIRHGAFCVGCCWMLMALLYVAGVMNLTWVAVIAAIVLMEKVFPAGLAIARTAGVILVAAGIGLLVWPAISAG